MDLIRDGKLAVSGGGECDLAFCKSDVVGNMKLIPKFDENDVERFFLLFERVADARNWPDEERTLMIHKTSFGSKTYGKNLQKEPWHKSVHSANLSRDPLGRQLHSSVGEKKTDQN